MNSEKGKITVLKENNKFELREYPVLPVKDDEIMIKIAMCGICGSDLHFSQIAEDYPLSLGHEIVGTIVEMGEKATKNIKCSQPLEVGDRVVVYPAAPCEQCYWDVYYGSNHTHICENDQSARPLDAPPYFIGGFSEYFNVAPGMWLSKIPEGLPWELAVLVEPFSIAIRSVERGTSLPAWKNEQTLAFGGTVAVLGAGGIGVLTAAAAKIAGAGQVVLVGAPQSALNTAKEAGFVDHIINIDDFSPEQRIEKVKSLTSRKYGADMVFEAAGNVNAFYEALEMVKKLGTVVELGCFVDTGDTVAINVARQILQKDLTIFASKSQAPQTFDKALATLKATQNQYDWRKLVTKYDLEDVQEAFATSCGEGKTNIKNAILGPAYEN